MIVVLTQSIKIETAELNSFCTRCDTTMVSSIRTAGQKKIIYSEERNLKISIDVEVLQFCSNGT
jgi:hypothetical protein